MNIYFILFIIVIPITIFFVTIFSDKQFKQRMQQLKSEITIPFNKILNTKSVLVKQPYRINDGIGFGFGKEFFGCKSEYGGLTGKQTQKLKNASIGVKFHKFKMNRNYNIPEIDDVVLKDYCSNTYLDKNFISILNGIWSQSGVNFFLRDMIDENEHTNLATYYNYSPDDNIIYPNCEDIVNFKNNPVKFSGSIPPPYTSTTPAVSLPTDYNNINSLFTANSIPNMATSQALSPPSHIKRVTDKDIEKMVSLDIYILQRILGKENVLNVIDQKNIIRNLFFRMTDETQYLNDRDLHIYLVPYIADDIAFILEGRNGRPLLVMSMFYKDCNKMEKVIDMVSTAKTCGSWLEPLLGNYNQLRNAESEYNKIANVNIKQNELAPCGPGEIDASPYTNDEITTLRDNESRLMQRISTLKNNNKDISKSRRIISVNLNKMDLLYNYDYMNDHEVKTLKSFKNRGVSRTIMVNGAIQEVLVRHDQLRNEKLAELKARNEQSITQLKVENARENGFIKVFETELDTLEKDLNDIRSNINKKMVPKKTMLKTLGALKKQIDTLTKEISAPMYYAEKIRNILNINQVILMLFGQLNTNLTGVNRTRVIDINKGEPICNVLKKTIINGGMTGTKQIKDDILNNKGNLSYLNVQDIPGTSLRNVILGPEGKKNMLFDINNANKCSVLGVDTIRLENATISNPISFCNDTKFYETGKLNGLDLDAQYYLVTQLLEKITDNNLGSDEIESLETFRKKIEYECTGCQPKDHSNYRAEPSFIKSKGTPAFFTEDEAIKNYEWLAKYIVKNRLNVDDDFIFYGADYLTNNSSIFTESLKNNFFPEETIVTDAIPCPILDKPDNLFNIDPTPLNDYILNKNTCNKSYMHSFKDSYI